MSSSVAVAKASCAVIRIWVLKPSAKTNEPLQTESCANGAGVLAQSLRCGLAAGK